MFSDTNKWSEVKKCTTAALGLKIICKFVMKNHDLVVFHIFLIKL